MEFNPRLKIWETSHLGEHDMVRRVDPKGEALVWSRPLLTRREEHDRAWKIMKIILKLGEGEVPDSSAEGWTVEGERRRVTRKE